MRGRLRGVRVRTLLALVALVALALAVASFYERAERYRRQGRRHRQVASYSASMINFFEHLPRSNSALYDPSTLRANAAAYRALEAHHRRLAEKYDRAAARPWDAVAPDPPEPVLAVTVPQF